MEKKRRKKKERKTRNTFIVLAVCPILVLILMVALFAYGEMKSICNTYQISADEMPSPYSLFDRVLLLNSYTKHDYMDLQDRAMRDPKVFLDNDYLKKENDYLKEKYSFLAVIVDGGFTFFGDFKKYDYVYRDLLIANNNYSEENGQYCGKEGQKFLFKKLGVILPDGRTGSVCIVTDLNVNLPHITVFSVGLVGIIVVVCVLIVASIIGHTYYNILVPIRQLQLAAIHISEGDLEYELPSMQGNEFEGLYRDFDNMQTRLRETTEERNQVDALTKEVIGNISHDLKTPLTAIKGYAEGIMDGVATTPERMERYVKTIHTKAVDMAVLVDELSYFTKIYQKVESFRFQPVKANYFFAQCISDMSLDLEISNIQLLYQCDVPEEVEISIDEEKIKRVVANIVGNAVKYIQKEQGMILVDVEEQDSRIQVMIRDNGKGIGKEELPYIFERFYRTDSSRNSQTGGSGLGLAIAKKIMDEHGGEIWAESEIGKGTAIYFTLRKTTEHKEEENE